MSDSLSSVPTPTGEFQAHFGGPPGSRDAAAECKKWEKLCGELLQEREKLRAELAHAQRERDAFQTAVMRLECENYQSPLTKEELFAGAVYEPTIPSMLERLKNEEA